METAARLQPKCPATSATSSALALPSTGGDFSCASQGPSAAGVRRLTRALGLTFTCSTLSAMDASSGAGSRHRLATRADLPQIVAIYNSTVPTRLVTADTEPVSVAERQPWFDAHQDPARPLWVCEDAAGISAWLSVSSFYGRPAYRRSVEVAIYVRPDRRRLGLGSYLLEALIAEAPRLEVDTLLGFIFGHNEPSLRLFRQFGFATWGTLPRVAVLDGVERDLVILGRRC